MPFLSVPLKKTAEVDLANPITQWMASAYSTETRPIDSNAIQEFQKLRTNAVCRPLDKHESSLESLMRYYDQLIAIENKIPFNSSQVCVYFKWKDAFDKGSLFFGMKSSLTLASGGLERAAVLFNIGALASQIAGAQPLDNDDELKTCSRMFQFAAGVFSMLKEHVLGWVGQEPTPDLMPDTLNALSALMIAQGQEAIYIKAARDKMKPVVVAKIAAQGADFYSEAHKLMGRESLRGLWEKDALSIITGKQNGFLGLAHYQQSLVANANKDIGPELAHLEAAMNHLSSGGAGSQFSKEAGQVAQAHKTAKKDNDFIYHERVPDVKSLPPIEKVSLSKAQHPKGHLSKNFKDLFANLIPVEVQQALSAYDTRRLEVVNGEVNRMQEATQILNGILSSLNLPAALEDACNKSAIPQSMREKASAVRAAGGASELQRMFNELPTLYTRNKEILEETQRLLKEEKTADDEMRAQHKEKWARMPSDKLTEPLWQELGKYRGIIESATRADAIVKEKYNANREGIDLLSKPENELVASIPSMQGQASASNLPSVARLRELMTRVDALKEERTKLEADLKDQSMDMSNVFMKAMAESGVINEQDISTGKLNEIYTPLREKVTASVSRQDVLASEIQVAHGEFSNVIGSSGGEREALLKKLSSAHDAYMELRSNLQEGSKFYNDLTPLLVRLQQKVSDFCFARRTEKEDLLRDLPSRQSTQPSRPPSQIAAGSLAPSAIQQAKSGYKTASLYGQLPSSRSPKTNRYEQQHFDMISGPRLQAPRHQGQAAGSHSPHRPSQHSSSHSRERKGDASSGGGGGSRAPPPRPPPPAVTTAPAPAANAPPPQQQQAFSPYPQQYGQNPYGQVPYGQGQQGQTPYPMGGQAYGQPQPFYGQQGPAPMGYGQAPQFPTYPGAPGNQYFGGPQQPPFNPYAGLQNPAGNYGQQPPPQQPGQSSPYPQQSNPFYQQ